MKNTNKKPWYQSVIVGGTWLFTGVITAGTLLDSLSNAISLVSLQIACIGSAAILGLWLAAYLAVKRYHFEWMTQDGTIIYLRKLSPKLLFISLGIALLLWAPLLLNYARNPQGNKLATATSAKVSYSAEFDSEGEGALEDSYQEKYRAEIELHPDAMNYRNGRVLNLPLADGKMKTFTDLLEDTERGEAYFFEGYFPK